MSYISDFFNYNRRTSGEVIIGNTALGGKNPIRLQSMTNTRTMDSEKSVEQAIRIINAGGEFVRLTAQGVREAENLKNIHRLLHSQNYQTPLVADIHFNPKAAEVAALYVEKVRINPGNFVDSVKSFATIDYTDEKYQAEIEKIRQKFIPFLAICKENNTAIRIGVNHGSLSDRIISRYGDTPEGMVESCMEFLRICREVNFNSVVISMKSSNVLVMVHSVRLLVKAMNKENMHYPLHLGVTEAGDGEDGRIKSAVGIGTLLSDGIGDTIRVSLSEEPEREIPVAEKLVNYITARQQTQKEKPNATCLLDKNFTLYSYHRRETNVVQTIGGNYLPVVIAETAGEYSIPPDFVFPDFSERIKPIAIRCDELSADKIHELAQTEHCILLLTSTQLNPVGEWRMAFHLLLNNDCKIPVILHRCYEEDDVENLQIKAAADFGSLFIDGFGDGIFLQNKGNIPANDINSIAFGILQASRVRVSKTEYISCPGCGRTLFDLQSSIARVKAKTAHLKGLKIGIMGCIVNGPGEMADADYGYVGAGKGKISLYKRKVCVEKNIPEEEAVDKLIELIKNDGLF